MSRRPLSARNAEPSAGGRPRKKRGLKYCVLPRREVVEALRELGKVATVSPPVSVSEEDLLRPTPDKIQQVYLMCLSVMFEIAPESLKLANFHQYNMDHPELFDDIIFRLKFFTNLKCFMEACCVDDFSMRDFRCPEEKRTIRHLSAIINYVKFFCSFAQTDTLKEYDEAMEQTRDQLNSRQEENAVLQERMDSMERQRREEHELEVELKQTLLSQEQQTLEIQRQQESLQLQLQSLAETAAGFNQRLSDLTHDREKVLHCCDELRSQIVSSPDKLRAHLGKLQSAIDPTKDSREQSQHLLHMWESLVSRAHQVPPVVEGVNEDLDRVMVKGVENSELQARMESMQENVSRKHLYLRDATAKLQNLQTHLKVTSDEARQMAFTDFSRSNTKGDLVDLEREYHQCQQQLQQLEMTSREYQREAEEQKKIHVEKKEAHMKGMDEMSAFFSQLERVYEEEKAACQRITDGYKALQH